MSDLRERISVAAQELFLQDGLEGFSMRKVAEKVGVSAPAIYRHYENKDELLNVVVTEALKILAAYLEPALEAGTPLERLRQLVERFLRFAVEQPQTYDCAFMVRTSSIDRMSEELAKHNWRTFQLAVEQVSECMATGVFKEADPAETAIMLWAEAHGLITLFKMHRFGPDDEMFQDIYRRCTDRMFDGLKADVS
jgi:AcrR family transcriptional regulator